MRRSPLAPVEANDPPMAWCPSCETKYNPYGQTCDCDE